MFHPDIETASILENQLIVIKFQNRIVLLLLSKAQPGHQCNSLSPPIRQAKKVRKVTTKVDLRIPSPKVWLSFRGVQPGVVESWIEADEEASLTLQTHAGTYAHFILS
jgi:hypothetical protein